MHNTCCIYGSLRNSLIGGTSQAKVDNDVIKITGLFNCMQQ